MAGLASAAKAALAIMARLAAAASNVRFFIISLPVELGLGVRRAVPRRRLLFLPVDQVGPSSSRGAAAGYCHFPAVVSFGTLHFDNRVGAVDHQHGAVDIARSFRSQEQG